jgi:hypothetical protein
LGKFTDIQAGRLIENTFVKAFKKIAEGYTSRKYWNQYISNYRGLSERDYRKVIEILRDDYGFIQLQDPTLQQQSFESKIRDHLLNLISNEHCCEIDQLDPITKDKARRDAKLIAALNSERQSLRSIAKPPNICIVSSARRLKKTDDFFRDELGQPDAVLSIPAVGFLLTLCPQVAMNISTLRSILFDPCLVERMNPMQRDAYRIIAASDAYDLPWSRRATLARELNQAIVDLAKTRDQSFAEIKRRFFEAKDLKLSTQLIAQALDKMAIESAPKVEISELRTKLEAANRELEKLRATRRPVSSRSSKKRRRGYKK